MGGPIGLLLNGDVITIDAEKRAIDVDLSDIALEKRRKNWKKPEPKIKSGALFRYMKTVASASLGCVTDI